MKALLCLLGVFFISTLSSPLFAQSPSSPSAASVPAPPAPTLAASLAQVEPLDPGELLLVAGAEHKQLPKEGFAPPPGSTYETIAANYGWIVQSFDSVNTISPPTMTVLNNSPADPDLYADMQSEQIFALLTATLSDDQWAALISSQGLAVTDLTSDTQRRLFAHMLSHDGKLILIPKYKVSEKWSDSDKLDLSSDLPQAHVRIGATVGFMLPVKDQPGSMYGGGAIPPADDAPRQYQIDDQQWLMDADSEAGKLHGVPIRATVPHTPKPSQLDYDRPAMRTSVTLSGIETAGELVARIGQATHVELYIDRRLADTPLTLIGAASARAGDLLKGLTFCLAGTFRQVGPAFVLTDDLIGGAATRATWLDFNQEVGIQQSIPITAAQNYNFAHHDPKQISWQGDPSQFSPEEEKKLYPNADSKLPNGNLTLPLSGMTPAQQELATRAVEAFNKSYSTQKSTTEGNFQLQQNISVQMLVPGLNQPVDLLGFVGSTSSYDLFQQKYDNTARAKIPKQQDVPTPNIASLTDTVALLDTAPVRAVIVHPRTAAGVDADIAAMKTLGLDEMWLDIFSDGVAYIPGTPLSHLPAPLKDGENDILTEALQKTRGTGIRVYPVMNLFSWGQSSPASIQGANVLGQTYDEAVARWNQLKAELPPGHQMPDVFNGGGALHSYPGVPVDPLNPAVQSTLTAVVRLAVQHDGIAGLVWRDAQPPGYQKSEGFQDLNRLNVGYTLAARLAFLRHDHSDPIDISPSGYQFNGEEYTEQPNFEKDYTQSSALYTDWQSFPSDNLQKLLRSLYTIADPAGKPATDPLPILVQQLPPSNQWSPDRDGRAVYPPGRYLPWSNLDAPPVSNNQGSQQSSKTLMMPIDYDNLALMRQYAANIKARQASHPDPVIPHTQSMNSFVLDLAADPFGDDGNGSDPLTNLASKVEPAPAAAAPAK